MKPQKPSRARLLSHCADLDLDDGIDPKKFFSREHSNQKTDRKARQLCSQVSETLSYVLAGECNDDLLRDLQIVQVQPAPDSSRLLVIVCHNPPDRRILAADVVERLAQASGKLRSEVARAITRKRAPKLVFEYAPSGPSQEGRP